MKRLVVLLLCVLFCVTLVSCGNTPAESVSTEPQHESSEDIAGETLIKVLNCEQTFTFKNTFDRVTEETLDQFKFNLPYQSMFVFVPKCYTFADVDADGVEELLIMDFKMFCILTLDYADGAVSGTVLDNFDSRDYQEFDWMQLVFINDTEWEKIAY